jgi:hypothetical protein
MHLYELFTEANKRMPGIGPKQWSTKLTAVQRAILAELPVLTADRGVLEHARAVAIAAFLREARVIADANAAPRPTALEVAVRGFLANEGFPLSLQ